MQQEKEYTEKDMDLIAASSYLDGHNAGYEEAKAEQHPGTAVWVKASEFKYEVGAPYHAKDSKSKGAGSFDESGIFKWGDDSLTLPHNQGDLLILDETGQSNKDEAVAFHDWVIANEYEINNRAQMTHTTAQLYNEYQKQNNE